jgi:hypothetical protein
VASLFRAFPEYSILQGYSTKTTYEHQSLSLSKMCAIQSFSILGFPPAKMGYGTYPNVIMVEYVGQDGGVTALAIAINQYLSPLCETSARTLERAIPFTA